MDVAAPKSQKGNETWDWWAETETPAKSLQTEIACCMQKIGRSLVMHFLEGSRGREALLCIRSSNLLLRAIIEIILFGVRRFLGGLTVFVHPEACD